MIKIKIDQHEGLIDSISIKGHADYDKYGKDIVCASISSIVATTINGIVLIDSDSIEYQENDGFVNINVLKHTDIVDTLIKNMINLLEDLELQYTKNIKINK